ncbi:uncharacterized protein PHACADRAFT_214274 [Phanerochaete carnosa HHB-10118-sp]|uniref:Uncharacterized protein n=1 Tax=Phanerochaete carnosa (strain HHB-10118-sp) TaxID=650164 RepID=K5VSK6_PHACS|nr:uncharacterized protein PHACADRAFT_214274 [Phanerochaete carnosa HHB-10118-sp]EKM49755.1 hypothetical protein PHACADRAFT_214274 [Phanerochaete carnosa HHB-10118-sp]
MSFPTPAMPQPRTDEYVWTGSESSYQTADVPRLASTSYRYMPEAQTTQYFPSTLRPVVDDRSYNASGYDNYGSEHVDGSHTVNMERRNLELCRPLDKRPLHVGPVIVEELEDRFGDRIDEMLQKVRSSLVEQDVTEVAAFASVHAEAASEQYFYNDTTYVERERWEHDANEVVFDDTEEGAGFEDDLDVDDG